MLSRLASGQAQTRRDVAKLLGVQRHTIGHWRALGHGRLGGPAGPRKVENLGRLYPIEIAQVGCTLDRTISL